MARNSVLRQRIADIVKEILAEQQQVTGNTDPESGTVTAINSDGTVNVQTTSGVNYSSVGIPIVATVGAQVVVVTADGAKVAVPR